MSKSFLITVFLFAAVATNNAQKRTAEFTISQPKKPVANSYYKTIRYVDSRDDTAYIGTVQTGLLNAGSDLVFEPALAVQLQSILDHLTDKTAKDGALLFQLRQLGFSQKPGGFSNKGYCFLKADLYADAGGHYQQLASLDTVILVKTVTTGTSTLINAAGECITALIADNLLNSGKDTTNYTYQDILKRDSLEKANLPVYNTNAYTDGIYEKWASFESQKPDWKRELIAEPKDGKISRVKFIDPQNETQELDAKLIYAIVYKGQPFIATEYGYYLLEKRGNEFYFTGKAKVYSGTGERFLSRRLLGPLSALYELNQKSLFEIKIDHTNGQFIRTKEVHDPGDNK